MALLGKDVVLFRKEGLADIQAFVRITPINKMARIAQGMPALDVDYEVSFDSNLQFSDGSRPDGTTRIVWGELTRPSVLQYPMRYTLPYSYTVAAFKNEGA